MEQRDLRLSLSGPIVVLCLITMPAHAQSRTWVSGAGDDANPCSRTEPCQTFAGTIAKTAAGGEVNCLDPGEYGAMIIDKSITIDCEEVGAPSTTGIYINAAATDTVSLRGLNIESIGAGTALGGITFTGAGTLHVEHCLIRGFNSVGGAGITFASSGPSELYVTESNFADNGAGNTGGGIVIRPTAAGVKAVLNRVHVEHNALGIEVDSTAGPGTVDLMVVDSVSAGNISSNIAVFTIAGKGTADVMVDRTNLSGSSIGLRSDGPATTVWIGRSMFTDNNTGVLNANGGRLTSFQNNQFAGNTANFSTSSGAVIYATSGSAADLQTAINKARTGDTVAVPAGRYEFTGSVSAPDGIYIRGAGRDSTYLIKSDNTNTPMIIVDSKTGMPFKFSGITLQGRLDALQGSNRTTAITNVTDDGLYIFGAATNFQIFDSRFTKFLRAGIEFRGDFGSLPGEQSGVIYRNEFIDNWYPTLGYGVAVAGSPDSWNRAITLGTSNAVFVEDNLFVLNRHCVTANNGANYVARYNTVKDNYQDAAAFDAHGLSSWPRGTRSVEIYGNVINNTIKRLAGAGIRGGSGVIWGNTWNGVSHGVFLSLEDDPPPSHPLTTYPAIDQIGNPDDLYIWNNVSSGDSVFLYPTSNPFGIDYWLKSGRDYFTTAKPGYMPYTYPHPLRTAN
jgi:hypothetical protein